MATTDSNGILFYEDTDAVSPLHTLLNAGQTSVSNAITGLTDGSGGDIVIHYVADTAARAAEATSYSPTVSKPLFVYRGDASVGSEIEKTEDGTTWHQVIQSPLVGAGLPAVNVDSIGRVQIMPATGSTGPAALDVGLLVEPRVNGAPALVVRGLPAQTEPLQKWMANTGFVFVQVNPTNATNTSYLALNFGGLGTRTVEIGPWDSGGAGYRMLRILN